MLIPCLPTGDLVWAPKVLQVPSMFCNMDKKYFKIWTNTVWSLEKYIFHVVDSDPVGAWRPFCLSAQSTCHVIFSWKCPCDQTIPIVKTESPTKKQKMHKKE